MCDLLHSKRNHVCRNISRTRRYAQTEEPSSDSILPEKKNRFYHHFFDLTSDPGLVTDRRGVILEANLAAATLFGIAPHNLVDKELAAFVALKDRKVFRGNILRLLKQKFKIGKNWEIDLQPRKGRLIHGEITVGTIPDPKGNLVTLLWIVRDNTKIKQAEWALHKYETKTQAIVNLLPHFAIAIDTDANITLINKVAAKRFGVTAQKAKGRKLFAFLPSKVAKARKWQVRDCIRTRAPARFKDSYHGRLIDGIIYPVEDAQGNIIRLLLFEVDITDRYHEEERLRRSEAKYRNLIELAHEGIWVIDSKNKTTMVNPRMAELLGYTVKEMLGRSIFSFMDKQSKAIIRSHLQDQDERRDVEFIRKDRTCMYAKVETSPLLDGKGQREGSLVLVDDLTDRKRAQEVIAKSMKDLELRVRERTRELVSANENLHAEMAKRVAAEKASARLRMELAYVTRVTTMGQLTASLAHELNQPLCAILSNAQATQQLLSGKNLDIDEIREAMADICDSATRAGDIILRLRSMLKNREVEYKPVNINDIVQDVLTLLNSEMVIQDISIECNLASNLSPILGDRVQLQQVVLNLLVNGCEAMNGLKNGFKKLAINTSVNSPGMIEVAIRDSGAGFAPGQLDKIFNPFFTTKPHGMGMGLSISRSIITSHGGELWAAANPDQGATFHFKLPIIQEGSP